MFYRRRIRRRRTAEHRRRGPVVLRTDRPSLPPSRPGLGGPSDRSPLVLRRRTPSDSDVPTRDSRRRTTGWDTQTVPGLQGPLRGLETVDLQDLELQIPQGTPSTGRGSTGSPTHTTHSSEETSPTEGGRGHEGVERTDSVVSRHDGRWGSQSGSGQDSDPLHGDPTPHLSTHPLFLRPSHGPAFTPAPLLRGGSRV